MTCWHAGGSRKRWKRTKHDHNPKDMWIKDVELLRQVRPT
jgi:hypothetical protein